MCFTKFPTSLQQESPKFVVNVLVEFRCVLRSFSWPIESHITVMQVVTSYAFVNIHMIAFQSKVDHPRVCVFSYDL